MVDSRSWYPADRKLGSCNVSRDSSELPHHQVVSHSLSLPVRSTESRDACTQWTARYNSKGLPHNWATSLGQSDERTTYRTGLYGVTMLLRDPCSSQRTKGCWLLYPSFFTSACTAADKFPPCHRSPHGTGVRGTDLDEHSSMTYEAPVLNSVLIGRYSRAWDLVRVIQLLEFIPQLWPQNRLRCTIIGKWLFFNLSSYINLLTCQVL